MVMAFLVKLKLEHPTESSLKPVVVSFQILNFAAPTADVSDEIVEVPHEAPPLPQHPLPSWNLNAERLRLLAGINQFEVKVKRLDLKPQMVDAIVDYNSDSFVRKVIR